MRLEDVSTIGIMFDNPRGSAPDDFPTLRELPYDWSGWLGERIPEALEDWRVVAYDPRMLRYFDEANEAIDETNVESILDNLRAALDVEELPTVRDRTEDRYSIVWGAPDKDVEEALRVGACHIGKVIALAPREDVEDVEEAEYDRDARRFRGEETLADAVADAWEWMLEARSSLANYPLLDESGYSEREYDAWQEYAPRAFLDEIRDASRDNDARFSEELLDEIEEHADELLPLLAQHLHYFDGFSGEYAPNFLDIFEEEAERVRVAFLLASHLAENLFALRLPLR